MSTPGTAVTRRPSVKATIALALVVAAAGYGLALAPKLAALERAERAEAKLRSNFEYKQQLAANLEQVKQQLRELKDAFGSLLNVVPSRVPAMEIMAFVADRAERNGVRLSRFEYETFREREFRYELPFTFVAAGDFRPLARFVNEILTRDRPIIDGGDFTLRHLPEQDTLELRMTCRTFAAKD